MKKLLLLLSIAVVIYSCDKNEKWDANAMISIRPEVGVKSSTNPEHLSALEIVEQTYSIDFTTNENKKVGRAIADAQRDITAPRLKMWGTDIITQRGEYSPGFIESYDFIFVTAELNDPDCDTIAYIPNAIIDKAEIEIKAAYANEDWEAVYEIFDEAFRFTPITGKEYLELKKKGLN